MSLVTDLWRALVEWFQPFRSAFDVERADNFITRLWVFLQFLALTSTVIIMVIKWPRTFLEWATTGLIASYAVIIARTVYQVVTGSPSLGQPAALVVWASSGILVGIYIEALRRTYLSPAIGPFKATVALVIAFVLIVSFAWVSSGI